MKKIKVLVVDDSAIVRKLLTDAISIEPDLEVVGTAPDPFVARDKILALHPDVITLDIEMPRMDGLTFLKALMKYHPMPAIMISSLCQSSAQQSLDAFRFGAVEVLAKPGGPYSVGELQTSLAMKIRAAATAKIRPGAEPPAIQAKSALPKSAETNAQAIAADLKPNALLAIGASTGGTEAIREVLTQLPASIPATVITQHIPPVFSRTFAERLDSLCPFEVREAVDGDLVLPNRVLVAPGNFHMVLRRSPEGLKVQVKDGPAVCYSRPSVDVMFSSVADTAGRDAIGVILTGMGSDGAQGMLKLKRAGAATIAQDEQSCVVYGMPKEAARLGAIDRTLPLHSIAEAILSHARKA